MRLLNGYGKVNGLGRKGLGAPCSLHPEVFGQGGGVVGCEGLDPHCSPDAASKLSKYIYHKLKSLGSPKQLVGITPFKFLDPTATVFRQASGFLCSDHEH